MKRLPVLLATLLPFILTGQIKEEWAVTFDNNPNQYVEYGNDIVVDTAGNSYVAGATSTDTTHEDFITIKYDNNGQLQWQKQYNGIGDTTDVLTSIALDDSGNVYVAGYSFIDTVNVELVVIKYDNNGNLQWQQTFADWMERYVKMAVDSFGNVYVTGGSYQLNQFNFPDQYITTLKYSSAGALQWSNIDTLGVANAIKISETGDIHISGPARNGVTWDYLAIKYDISGNKLWEARWDKGFNSNDWPAVITVDEFENVYVSGNSEQNGPETLTTIKYDSSGNQIWIVHTDTTSSSNYVQSVKVDTAGNIFLLVTTYVNGAGRPDFYLVKLNSSGNKVWAQRYLGPYNYIAQPFAMTIDDSSNVYVAGWTISPVGSNDCVILKYDKDGNKLWEVIKVNSYSYGNGGINAITLDQDLGVYVTGVIDSGNTNNQPHIITIKYSPCSISPTFPIVGLDTVCANDLGLLYNTSGTNSSTFQWIIGGGVQATGSTSASISVDWEDGGSWPYTWSNTNIGQGLITVFETDSNGCIANSVTKWVVIETCSYVPEQDSPFTTLTIYPNPFSDQTTIEFELRENGLVHLDLLNTLGQTVLTLDKPTGEGKQRINIDKELPAGLYFAKLTINDLTTTEKIIKE
jgi:hypothetical protein